MTEATITDVEFAQFQRLIHQIAGISLSDSKKELLVGRLGGRLRALNLPTFGAYYRHVASGNDTHERQTMLDLLTTNETYFFREEAHFDFLRQVAIPQHSRGVSLDIWSGASSTGEEVYTLAMVLADELGTDGLWSILGSDISARVLAIAQGGHYWLDRVRGLPPSCLRKYCLRGIRAQEGSFLIDPALRRHTRFMQINLNATLPEVGKFHIIFLRNAMIYFDNDTKRKVVARMVEKLRPGGYFIVGHSESLHGVNEILKPVKPTIYRLPG
jgi:chemotaxis protein methyltransferase CheR